VERNDSVSPYIRNTNVFGNAARSAFERSLWHPAAGVGDVAQAVACGLRPLELARAVSTAVAQRLAP